MPHPLLDRIQPAPIMTGMNTPGQFADPHRPALGGSEIFRAYVEGQVRLGYGSFDPGPLHADVILAAFPKSGSTWTSYLMHQIRTAGEELSRDIKEEVIDITPGHWDPEVNPFRITQRHAPRTFKTHGSYKLCPKGGKYIYLARDPKDTLWSLYNFLHDLFDIADMIPIETFFDEYFLRRYDTGHDIGNPWDHFLEWGPHRDDGNIFWMHYEDLLEARLPCLRAMAQFMGVVLSDDALTLVAERSDIGHSRKIADRLNPSPDNRVGKIVARFGPATAGYAKNMQFGKVRRGVNGGGQRNLPPAVLDEFSRQWGERIAPVLGWDSYGAMRESCSILENPENAAPPAGVGKR